jgi:hypothetical protein
VAAVHRLMLLVVLALSVVACGQEQADPIDLGAGRAGTAEPDAGSAEDDPEPGSMPPTPHAVGENPQARAHAEQQCVDHPEQEQGVIRIVDPSTNAVVGEVVVDCDEVLAERDATTEP